MLLGGSPGSTAGGMKTTTFAVLLANMWATFRRREDAEFFGLRIDSSAVKNAATIAGMYLTLFFLGAFVIATAEQLPMSVCLYETASAVATVGLTLGITPQLGILSQGVLLALMFLGRVGGLTLIYAAFGSSPAPVSYTHLNVGSSSAAPASSNRAVIRRIKPVSRTMPPICCLLYTSDLLSAVCNLP